MSSDRVNVLIAMNFSDDLVNRVRDVSPRLHVERHYPDLPESAYADAEVLYTLRHFPAPEQAPKLRWVQLHYAGMEEVVGLPIAASDRITITSASGIHAVPMMEWALAMMLAFEFKLRRMFDYQREATYPEDRHKIFAPRHLRGQTLGIVGYGSIGRELARAAAALGMRVLAVKRDVMHPAQSDDEYTEPGTGDPAGDIPARIYPMEALVGMAGECDYLALLTPLTEQTRNLVDARVLAAMKPTGVLLNMARGGVVDEPALIEALQRKRIGGAALDVFATEPLPADSPLWKLENVLISPHVSGNSVDYNERMTTLFIENLTRYLERRPLLNRLDLKRGY